MNHSTPVDLVSLHEKLTESLGNVRNHAENIREIAVSVRRELLIVTQEREAITAALDILADDAATMSALRADIADIIDNLAPPVPLPPIPPAIDRAEIIPANLNFHAEIPSIFDGAGIDLTPPGKRLRRRAGKIADPAVPLIPDMADVLPELNIDDLVDIDLDDLEPLAIPVPDGMTTRVDTGALPWFPRPDMARLDVELIVPAPEVGAVPGTPLDVLTAPLDESEYWVGQIERAGHPVPGDTELTHVPDIAKMGYYLDELTADFESAMHSGGHGERRRIIRAIATWTRKYMFGTEIEPEDPMYLTADPPMVATMSSMFIDRVNRGAKNIEQDRVADDWWTWFLNVGKGNIYDYFAEVAYAHLDEVI